MCVSWLTSLVEEQSSRQHPYNAMTISYQKCAGTDNRIQKGRRGEEENGHFKQVHRGCCRPWLEIASETIINFLVIKQKEAKWNPDKEPLRTGRGESISVPTEFLKLNSILPETSFFFLCSVKKNGIAKGGHDLTPHVYLLQSKCVLSMVFNGFGNLRKGIYICTKGFSKTVTTLTIYPS